MERMPYAPKNNLSISTQNEPAHHTILINDFRLYPDMYAVYKKIRSLIGHNRFILTNGCENALRIALLAVRPRNLQYEYPGWGLVPVIAESLDIPHQPIQFEIINGSIEYKPTNIIDTIYITDRINNFFPHKNMLSTSKKIIDISYTMDIKLIQNESYEDFIIGSFSKVAAPGLRLGILIYPEKYRKRVNLLREQYINSAAASYILKLNSWPKFNINENQSDGEPLFRHATYSLYKDKPINVPYKKVSIGNKILYRVGVTPLE